MSSPRNYVYAVMAGNRVVNVVVAHASFAVGRPDHVRIDTVVPRPGPGWTRVHGQWSPPVVVHAPHVGLGLSLDAFVAASKRH